MQNKKIIILIALGVVAAISLFYGIVTPSKVNRNIISEQASSSKGLTFTTGKKIVCLARTVGRTKYLSWAIDPFSPSSAPIKGYGWLTLEGIMWSKENPEAIINDNIVKIGDQIDKNTVVDIEQDRVILNDGDNDFELTWGK